MPKSTTRTPSGMRRSPGEALRHLDAEAVVAEEDVADAGDEDAPVRRQRRRLALRSSGSTSSGAKKKRWPGCRGPERAAGIVVDDDGEVERPS